MRKTVLGMMVAGMALLGVDAMAQDAPYCREYQRKVTVGGRVVDSYGTACMQPDGSWKLDSGDTVNSIDEPVYGAYADDYVSGYGAPVQVASMAPVYVQRQVVYEEPVYTSYRYYSGPSWGLSMGWSDRDGWRGHRGRDWHGGHGRGHGGHRH